MTTTSTAAREYDVGLIGVTGYTGSIACKFARDLNEHRLRNGQRALKFAFCARNKDKLHKLVQEYYQPRCSSPNACTVADKERAEALAGTCAEVVCENLADVRSLDAFTSKVKSVASYAGPFALCGEQILSSCVRSGTHYVDVTAELHLVKKMELKYGDDLRAKGIKAVSSCGYDFLPNDLMMMQMGQLLEQDETLKSWGGCETMKEVCHSCSQSTPMVSGGTALSAVYMAKWFGGIPAVLSFFLNPYAMVNTDAGKRYSQWSLAQLLTLPANYLQPKYVEAPHECASVRVIQSDGAKLTEADSLQNMGNRLCQSDGSKTSAVWREYCVNFCMSYLMTKYMHWSNSVQNYRFGKNLNYYGGEIRRNIVWAYFWSFMVWVGVSYVMLLSIFPINIAAKFVPKAGTGPLTKPDEDYLYTCLRATWPQGEVLLKWRLIGGESYTFAAQGSLVAAALLADENAELPKESGYLPPSVAMGPRLLSDLVEYTELELSAAQLKVF